MTQALKLHEMIQASLQMLPTRAFREGFELIERTACLVRCSLQQGIQGSLRWRI